MDSTDESSPEGVSSSQRAGGRMCDDCESETTMAGAPAGISLLPCGLALLARIDWGMGLAVEVSLMHGAADGVATSSFETAARKLPPGG